MENNYQSSVEEIPHKIAEYYMIPDKHLVEQESRQNNKLLRIIKENDLNSMLNLISFKEIIKSLPIQHQQDFYFKAINLLIGMNDLHEKENKHDNNNTLIENKTKLPLELQVKILENFTMDNFKEKIFDKFLEVKSSKLKEEEKSEKYKSLEKFYNENTNNLERKLIELFMNKKSFYLPDIIALIDMRDEKIQNFNHFLEIAISTDNDAQIPILEEIKEQMSALIEYNDYNNTNNYGIGNFNLNHFLKQILTRTDIQFRSLSEIEALIDKSDVEKQNFINNFLKIFTNRDKQICSFCEKQAEIQALINGCDEIIENLDYILEKMFTIGKTANRLCIQELSKGADKELRSIDNILRTIHGNKQLQISELIKIILFLDRSEKFKRIVNFVNTSINKKLWEHIINEAPTSTASSKMIEQVNDLLEKMCTNGQLPASYFQEMETLLNSCKNIKNPDNLLKIIFTNNTKFTPYDIMELIDRSEKKIQNLDHLLETMFNHCKKFNSYTIKALINGSEKKIEHLNYLLRKMLASKNAFEGDMGENLDPKYQDNYYGYSISELTAHLIQSKCVMEGFSIWKEKSNSRCMEALINGSENKAVTKTTMDLIKDEKIKSMLTIIPSENPNNSINMSSKEESKTSSLVPN